MEDRRFDDFARALAVRRGRRGFVLGLVGAAAGLVTNSAAVAACPAGQVLRRGMGCVCKTTGRPATNGGCPCAHGQYRCDGVCSRGPCEPSDPPSCSPVTCPAPGVCRDGVCCQPRGACADDECGPVDDGCDGTLACGPCCEPDCDGKQCGDDGCAGSCGECDGVQVCSPTGICQPPPGCSVDAECGGGHCCNGTCQDIAVCPECVTNDDCLDRSTVCALGICFGGTCILSASAKNGESCFSLDPCKPGLGVCASGQCVVDDKDCSHLDGPCAVGVCNPANGACVAQATNEGGACQSTQPCTSSGECRAGVCQGIPVECPEAGPCQEGPGTCNPATGWCEYQNKPNYERCDGSFCCNGVCCGVDELSCLGEGGTCSGLCHPTGHPCIHFLRCCSGHCDLDGFCT